VITVNKNKSDLRLTSNDGTKMHLLHITGNADVDHEQTVRAFVSHMCKHKYIFSKTEVQILRQQYLELGEIKGIAGKMSTASTEKMGTSEEMSDDTSEEGVA